MRVDEHARDVGALTGSIRQQAVSKGFRLHVLGTVGSDELLMLDSAREQEGPHLLIAAGFHGEESAGPWGVLSFLERVRPQAMAGINLSIIPIVNPSGLRAGRRQNDWGENPNSGFCHPELDRDPPSREGRILLDNLAALVARGQDGFLSLHEDIDQERFYCYTFEPGAEPGPFSNMLRDTGCRCFGAVPDCADPDIGQVRNGIIYRHCDGSFEDRLFHEGVPRTACTETPGKRQFTSRVDANRAIVNSFVDYMQREHRMSYDDAEEFFEFNMLGAWMGERTPAFFERPYRV